MAIEQFNLEPKQRAERKLLVTVVEWKDANGAITIGSGTDSYKVDREIIGTRTEDSSIEYNAEVTTTTDIRGQNWTEVDRTQPQQSVDPYTVMGDSKLGAKLDDIRVRNAVSEFNQFRVYVITAYIGNSTDGYKTQVHDDCTISINSIGGDSFVNMPIDIYLSNNYNDTGAPGIGTVNMIKADFVFTPTVVG